ncbi:uncharacterized protein [Engystomops pustulosus]|uniref:uncharacterized protein n=1 Tax=Engystomops pustulosus TaxID=76066 RepID=UPI003AFA1072
MKNFLTGSSMMDRVKMSERIIHFILKDVMMEDHQPLTSAGRSSKRASPERCPSPLLLPQDCSEEKCVPRDHQDEDVNNITAPETYVRGDERCKEEIPTGNCPDDCTKSSEEHMISESEAEEPNMSVDTSEEQDNIPDESSDLHRTNPSPEPIKLVPSTESSGTAKNIIISHTEELLFICSECGKSYTGKINFLRHQRIRTWEKPYSCSECGKTKLFQKSYLARHQSIHTGEKPYSCSGQTAKDEDVKNITAPETYVRGDERCKEEIPTGNCPGE